MFTYNYQPHPALLEYIDSICIMGHEFVKDDLLYPFYIYMPTHTRFMCFHLGDPVKVKKGAGLFEERARCIIIGPQKSPVCLDLGQKHKAVVVVLKPCGLYRLLGIPLQEIVDCDFDARILLGPEIDELIERLMETKCNENLFTIIQNYLLHKLKTLKNPLPIDRAMLQLVNLQGNLSMERLARESCLSLRQLERQSLNRVGVSPKYFAKMIRFSEAYKYKERNPGTTWTEISHQFSYYDQMHLIRDFRHFTGSNPGIFKEESIVHSIKLIHLSCDITILIICKVGISALDYNETAVVPSAILVKSAIVKLFPVR